MYREEYHGVWYSDTPKCRNEQKNTIRLKVFNSVKRILKMVHQQYLEKIKTHLAEQFSLQADQIEMMLPSFLAALQAHMQNLEKALEQNNPLLLGKAGHTIKGAFLNLGLGECASVALRIEERGKQGDTSIDYGSLVEDLRVRISPLLRL